MSQDLSILQLQNDVHEALKMWYQTGAETSPLAYLQLFRQTLPNSGGNPREATNTVLLKALEILEIDHEFEANLLRKRFLDGLAMHVVANQLNMSQTNAYRKQNNALKQLALVLQSGEAQAREQHRKVLEKRLEPPFYVQLIGIADQLNSVRDVLSSPGPPWMIAIEGLGGIGKTSLADALARQIIGQNLFDDFGWVSARQYVLNPGGGIKPVDAPALTAEDLVDRLTSQLMPEMAQSGPVSSEDALTTLQTRLKQTPHLIVVDNLETITDIESLLPSLRQLTEPSKILLTSRKSLHHEPGIYHVNLAELSEANALRLIRYEARLHNLPQVQTAGDESLKRIIEIVGGNPLALRLVVGQMHVHPLDVILEDLTKARGQKVEMLYTFIYRRAWDSLSEPTRQVFLAMPLVAHHGGSLVYLANVIELEDGQIRDALDRLVALNLVNSSGDMLERRYTIHNLTRTFLHEQVVRWD